jgi:hypothetical protein
MSAPREAALLDAVVVPPPNLDAQVVYLPVRHHSPACAHHVRVVLEQVRPSHVLIEGPRDASALIPFLQDPAARPPLAIYTTYTRPVPDAPDEHRASYYPLCDYSPEWVALRTAAQLGAAVRFIDLSFPEMVEAGRTQPADHADSLQEESRLSHNAFLLAAARRAGARDADDLWDHLFEANYRRRSAQEFFHGVLTYCACARATDGASADQRDDLAREACMAAQVAELATQGTRIVVVTGGYHTVALPSTRPRSPRAVKLRRPQDAGVTLMRYNFEQLDRLNGYASGMPSPGFYQRAWDGEDPVDTLVELARALRGERGEPSPSEAIVAVQQLRQLSALRGHAQPTREDLLDVARSVYVKGSLEIEGVRVLAAARKLFAGERVGDVPAAAGRPPIVLDFEAQADAMKLARTGVEDRDVVLDLYRSRAHRRVSRLLHQLAVLQVPFASKLRGPDFVAARDQDRIQEAWCYRWSPATEGSLIEASKWGAALLEATAACLLSGLVEVERGDARADHAAQLLVEAARCGLHRHVSDFARRTGRLVAGDADFVSVVLAAARLALVDAACEPLELHGDEDLAALARRALERALYLLPQLARTAESDEAAALDALKTLRELSASLGEQDAERAHLLQLLGELCNDGSANAVCAGAAAGLLHGDGAYDGERIGRLLSGRLVGKRDGGVDGARFLRGVLATDRSASWQNGALVAAIDAVIRDSGEDAFHAMLPHLRLAFAELSPRETDRVAGLVGELHAGRRPKTVVSREWSEQDQVLAQRVDAAVRAQLAEDGLLASFEASEVVDER